MNRDSREKEQREKKENALKTTISIHRDKSNQLFSMLLIDYPSSFPFKWLNVCVCVCVVVYAIGERWLGCISAPCCVFKSPPETPWISTKVKVNGIFWIIQNHSTWVTLRRRLLAHLESNTTLPHQNLSFLFLGCKVNQHTDRKSVV